MSVARHAIQASKAKVVKPPSRCPITTMGLSNQVTVHMPSRAWKMMTARVRVEMRARSTFDQRSAPASSRPSPNTASIEAAACWPRMYNGMASATASDAPSTCHQPCGRLRVASKASTSTSTPRLPAIMRWNCSRHALWGITGRMAVAA